MPSPSENRTLATLREARELISLPEHWTQGHSARDETGSFCSPRSSRARCWCAMGALERCGQFRPGVLWSARDLLRVLIDTCVSAYNDHHTHAEVLALFDRAIAAAEAA